MWSGAVLVRTLTQQQLQHQVSHYVHKKPNFQVSRKNSKWNIYIYPNHPLQKWLVEAYKWITMPSGPGPTFPVARLAWMSHTMETSWSPKSFRLCTGKLTKFGKTLLQCHVLLCSAWSTLGKDCNLLDTLKAWRGWTSRQVLALKFFKFMDQIFTKHILCAKPFPRIDQQTRSILLKINMYSFCFSPAKGCLKQYKNMKTAMSYCKEFGSQHFHPMHIPH